MHVGVNYPWFDYGWDFGPAPPGWRGSLTAPGWTVEIDRHLQHLHDLGISVVRWFVLADGLAYGTGPDAPTLDSSGEWRFDPAPLDATVLDDFGELLRRFADFNAGVQRSIRLLPVLIDFHFCNPGALRVLKPDPSDPSKVIQDTDWVKQGRADAIADADKRRTFLDEVLDPFLQVSQNHADVIYAWESINEPEWITNGWHPDGRDDHPIDERFMRAFLDESTTRIRRAGFRPTIGFALLDTLRDSGITTEINQFHHYPGGSIKLPRQTFDPRFPAIIGEFATASNDIWPDLGERQTVLDRLQRAAAKGYPIAMPWAFRTQDRHTSWTAAVEDDIRTFTAEQAPADVTDLVPPASGVSVETRRAKKSGPRSKERKQTREAGRGGKRRPRKGSRKR
ncbi:MAG TPA: hypothetical protein VHI99_11915 [Vicinamibacterales bacterium]|nr:hypothetical protein [Vicinamibacterales bacterium]